VVKRRRLSKQEERIRKLQRLTRRDLVKKERPICNVCFRPVGSCDYCRKEMQKA